MIHNISENTTGPLLSVLGSSSTGMPETVIVAGSLALDKQSSGANAVQHTGAACMHALTGYQLSCSFEQHER